MRGKSNDTPSGKNVHSRLDHSCGDGITDGAAAARAAARIRPTGRHRPVKTSAAPSPPVIASACRHHNPGTRSRPPAGTRVKRVRASPPTIQPHRSRPSVSHQHEMLPLRSQKPAEVQEEEGLYDGEQSGSQNKSPETAGRQRQESRRNRPEYAVDRVSARKIVTMRTTPLAVFVRTAGPLTRPRFS